MFPVINFGCLSRRSGKRRRGEVRGARRGSGKEMNMRCIDLFGPMPKHKADPGLQNLKGYIELFPSPYYLLVVLITNLVFEGLTACLSKTRHSLH